MTEANSEYTNVVRNSEKVAWKLDDIITETQNLDFSRPFVPASLVQPENLDFLSSAEKRTLNQISTRAYLNLFVVAEDFVEAMVLNIAKDVKVQGGDFDRVRALSRFSDEEVKHQQIFQRFERAFARGFKHQCDVIGPPTAITQFAMSKHTTALLILTLQFELCSQLHYTEAIKDSTDIDPLFVKLFKYHWMEESQHAAIDILELENAAPKTTPEELETVLKDYFELTGAFNGLLAQQGTLDVAALERATGRKFSESESKTIAAAQHVAYSKMFMSSGMLHKRLMEVVGKFGPDVPKRVKEWVRANLPEGPSLPI